MHSLQKNSADLEHISFLIIGYCANQNFAYLINLIFYRKMFDLISFKKIGMLQHELSRIYSLVVPHYLHQSTRSTYYYKLKINKA